MKCIEYANKLMNEGWKVVNQKDYLLTLQKNNQQRVIDLRFDTSVKAAGTGIGWTNSGNIVSSNDVYATDSRGTPGSGNILYAYNFGFAIPSGATISTISVKIERHCTNLSVKENVVAIGLYGGTYYTNKATGIYWTANDTNSIFSYSPADWGWSGITAENINNTNFGIKFQALFDDADTTYIDYVEFTITYTPAITFIPQIIVI